MGWLRAHRRVGASVALLAMVLQLVGLFGHLHLRDTSDGVRAFKSHIVAASNPTDAATDHGTLPHDGDTVCAACIVGHIVSAAIVAFAPPLFAPVAHQQRAPPSHVALAAFDLRLPFWSRGPPAI